MKNILLLLVATVKMARNAWRITPWRLPKLTLKNVLLLVVTLPVVSGLATAAGYYGAKAMAGKPAAATSIMLATLDDYKQYEALDRQQGLMASQAAQLKAQYDAVAAQKLMIRKRLGVPESFVEKRENDKDGQSPVVGFVAPPDPPAKQ
jgi:hypothetical protein